MVAIGRISDVVDKIGVDPLYRFDDYGKWLICERAPQMTLRAPSTLTSIRGTLEEDQRVIVTGRDGLERSGLPYRDGVDDLTMSTNLSDRVPSIDRKRMPEPIPAPSHCNHPGRLSIPGEVFDRSGEDLELELRYRVRIVILGDVLRRVPDPDFARAVA